MRTSLMSIVTVAGLAACGGSKKPANTDPDPGDTGGDPAGGGGGRVMAPGTSGLPGLDWGSGPDAILAFAPGATADDTGYVSVGDDQVQHFTLAEGGLIGVEIVWTEAFASMGDCLKTWEELRAELDGQWGSSQSDNGAAYWEVGEANVTLACNPNETDGAVLAQSHEPKPAF